MNQGFKVKTKWKLDQITSKQLEPKYIEEVTKPAKDFIQNWQQRSDYTTDERALKEMLDELEYLWATTGTTDKLDFSLSLKYSLDQSNKKVKSQLNKLGEIGVRLANDLEFVSQALKNVSLENQKKFLNSKLLKDYHHHLETFFENSKHLLSLPEEKIMNLKSKTSYGDWVRMTSEFLSKEKAELTDEDGVKSEKSFEEIISLASSTNEKVRTKAAKIINEFLEKHASVAEAELNAVLYDKKVNDELRKFEYPENAALIGDDVDRETVNALVSSVTENFGSVHRFYKLKATEMGKTKLTYFEKNVPETGLDLKYSFDESVNIVGRVFKKLDPQFAEIYYRILENGQVDVFPATGKHGGAFCAHNLQSQPVYILLNFNGKLQDILTLAHEMGHAINFELTRKSQNSLNIHVPTSTAEVASTFMEDFVVEELEKTLSPQTKRSLELYRLREDVSTIFRQIACYNFEKELHEKFRKNMFLSKEDIGQIFLKHMKSYTGPAITYPVGAENWWIYWSHIRSYFYVYTYAFGELISKYLRLQVRSDPKYINKVKEFLSSGSVDSPKNILRKIGVDISDKAFWDAGMIEYKSKIRELSGTKENIAK